MKAWRKHRNDREHWPEHWRWAVAMRRFGDQVMFVILANGKRVRFERKRNVPMKRAMQLMQAARNKKGGDHNADKKPHRAKFSVCSRHYETIQLLEVKSLQGHF